MPSIAVFVMIPVLVSSFEAKARIAKNDRSARILVQQLGADRYQVRIDAETRLIEIGPDAYPALRDGEKHDDLHVRDRCQALPALIQKAVVAKKQKVLLGGGAVDPSQFPYLKPFLIITGDTSPARQLYAEMLETHAALLEQAACQEHKGAPLFASHCKSMTQRLNFTFGQIQELNRSISRADVTVFWLLSHQFVPESNGGGEGYEVLRASVIADTLRSSNSRDQPFNALFLHWLRNEQRQVIVEQAFALAVEAKMAGALPLLLERFKSTDTPVTALAQYALFLPKLGDERILKDVEPLLSNKTIIAKFGINNVVGEVQMRDIALGVCIKLSGQRMADYDFDVMKDADEMMTLSYLYCAFSSEAKREAAHKKYRRSCGVSER